ncbi:NACHT, LRR and PYD domains-containing protein 1b allele 3-like [Centropristis striata]|uniref:NACHT, LRR and PYD domains-containing protein 1b allele 3-like n=1 Tax=Centropristis striata TaxID=184440 RepID=UPI0027E21555|nr:NACHT, LRR and PYD domains-containing protein 1b allele 3-like [Centropristis striata]
MSSGATGENTMAEDKHFVDKHRKTLIQRVCTIKTILDELLDQRVLQQETYTEIMVKPTTQDKVRALYDGPLKSATACKDIFYKVLEDNEPYLMKELKGN